MDVNKKWKIGIIGVGMVGTPLKRHFEELRGHRRGTDLFLYDTDPKKGFFDDINQAEIIFISVPTPRSADGSANLSAVDSAFARIKGEPPASAGEPRQEWGGKIAVIKSTVPPGMTEEYQRKYPQHKILFNPEFLTEKQAWEDFIKPDRQIVGFTSQSLDAAYLVLSLLPKAPFMSPWGMNTYKRTKITATEAELIKYGCNIHFSRKINFANLLASVAGKFGADYENVRAGLAADCRVGDSHMDVNHGGYKGFGGFCFPKDLDAFIFHLEKHGFAKEAKLLQEDREFNRKLLESQSLTLEDVSVHDHEWIKKKLEGLKEV